MICLLIETYELTAKAYKGGRCKYELETIIIFCVKSFVPLTFG